MAVLDGDEVAGHTVFPAPAAEAESAQHRELYVRAHELLRSTGAEALVVWQLDPPPKRGAIRLLPALTVGRAEGAVLAAAGQLGIHRVGIMSGAGVRAAAGGGGTDDAVEALCAPLRGSLPKGAVHRAAAAARAWVVRGCP